MGSRGKMEEDIIYQELIEPVKSYDEKLEEAVKRASFKFPCSFEISINISRKNDNRCSFCMRSLMYSEKHVLFSAGQYSRYYARRRLCMLCLKTIYDFIPIEDIEELQKLISAQASLNHL